MVHCNWFFFNWKFGLISSWPAGGRIIVFIRRRLIEEKTFYKTDNERRNLKIFREGEISLQSNIEIVEGTTYRSNHPPHLYERLIHIEIIGEERKLQVRLCKALTNPCVALTMVLHFRWQIDLPNAGDCCRNIESFPVFITFMLGDVNWCWSETRKSCRMLTISLSYFNRKTGNKNKCTKVYLPTYNDKVKERFGGWNCRSRKQMEVK